MKSNSCQNCSKQTANPKFCSRSCAAQVTNKIAKKKKTKFSYCNDCGKECAYRRKYCKGCFKKNTCVDLSLREAIYEHHHKASAFALIRSRARYSEKAKFIKGCQRCGYNRHVEVCHIKPISSFPLNTKLSVINAETNLIILCPNCHWEHDHPLV
jgi:hypothetical protein